MKTAPCIAGFLSKQYSLEKSKPTILISKPIMSFFFQVFLNPEKMDMFYQGEPNTI